MRTMLQRRKWQATDKTDAVLEPLLNNIKAMQAMEKRVSTATELPELLGIEGNASAAYFGSFGFMLKSELGFDFQRRSRRPPADATNALLSFAYSLLTADIISAYSDSRTRSIHRFLSPTEVWETVPRTRFDGGISFHYCGFRCPRLP